jgi:hypothetical protein
MKLAKRKKWYLTERRGGSYTMQYSCILAASLEIKVSVMCTL